MQFRLTLQNAACHTRGGGGSSLTRSVTETSLLPIIELVALGIAASLFGYGAPRKLVEMSGVRSYVTSRFRIRNIDGVVGMKAV